ncbi:hypothetical protein ABE65_019720 [Fictibacillus phosphorivorans]|uniref:DUF2569 domain-containing protein n=1 Tax=Fictibacillus phosphorivorans TaxID=1221500 RepID=A0A160IRJ2_9BACL|nr:DUF2569 domain-containing protein [Fictibacillus phosphorivorans]ANC78907.1 hypothetical protein ABE65_019720 [Fictibacillus phosphorivorans]
MKTQPKQKEDLKGLGGWLILVGVGLILALPYKLDAVQVGFHAIRGYEFKSLLLKYVVYGEFIFNIGLIGLNVYLLYLFFTKKKAFVKTWIFLLQISLVFAVLIDLLLLFVEEINTETPFVNSASALLAFIIWSTYAKKSWRVQNTFIN